MPARYLLDTNTVSYAIRGEPLAVHRHLIAAPSSSIALSSFTQAELLYGLARKHDAARLRSAVTGFLGNFVILPWDSAIAAAYGDLRAAQERKGQLLSHEDLMIASHALSFGITLVTADRAFSFVDGLRTEDWTIV